MSELQAEMSDFENIIAPGKEPNMRKPYKPHIPYKMERYLSPQTLKSYVLASAGIKALIERHSRETQRPPMELVAQVAQILDEIGLERNLPIIRWCGMAITAIGRRISDGIHVNAASIAKLKSRLGSAPVLYLPSHRSYMDFILMSYVCFYYDIEIPGIAAGMDFHSMFGMGTMLRKTGAFFMRRSFSNDELYWDVFREYIYALVVRYHIGVEFFIEGTRSRNFKALAPKIGLLSMALLPYFTGEVPDVIIVPVSISYERLLEEQLYVYELLGVPKPKESTRGFLKALRIIDEHFGKMYLDFGEPISVRDYLGVEPQQRMQRANIAPHLQLLNPGEMELIRRIAYETVYQQQRGIVLNTFNLVSLYYSSQLYAGGGQSVNLDDLQHGVLQLKRIFEQLGAHISTTESNLLDDILRTLNIHANILCWRNNCLEFSEIPVQNVAQQLDPKRLKAHALSAQTMVVAVPMVSLQLYVNPCLFWLARPGIVLLAAIYMQTQPAQSHDATLQSLLEHAKALDEVFQQEFINDGSRTSQEFGEHLRLLQTSGVLKFSAASGQLLVNHNVCSHAMLAALVPFLCLYYQLAVTLREFPAQANFAQKQLLVRVQQRIEAMLQQPEATNVHPYCLALDNLNVAINSLIQANCLQKQRESGMLSIPMPDALLKLEEHLQRYCQLMPFDRRYHTFINQNILRSQSKL